MLPCDAFPGYRPEGPGEPGPGLSAAKTPGCPNAKEHCLPEKRAKETRGAHPFGLRCVHGPYRADGLDRITLAQGFAEGRSTLGWALMALWAMWRWQHKSANCLTL